MPCGRQASSGEQFPITRPCGTRHCCCQRGECLGIMVSPFVWQSRLYVPKAAVRLDNHHRHNNNDSNNNLFPGCSTGIQKVTFVSSWGEYPNLLEDIIISNTLYYATTDLGRITSVMEHVGLSKVCFWSWNIGGGWPRNPRTFVTDQRPVQNHASKKYMSGIPPRTRVGGVSINLHKDTPALIS